MADKQNSQSLTYEQLGEEANKLDVQGLQEHTHSLLADKAIDIPKVCEYYHKFRPFLELILKLGWIIPKAIVTGIKAFMSVMDQLCPS
jgi:hypothetical protein